MTSMSGPHLGSRARLLLCEGVFAAAAALAFNVSLANEQQPKKAEPSDVRAVFEVLIARMCERDVTPLLQKMASEIGAQDVVDDPEAPKLICGCTARVAADGPKMKAVFERPAEQLSSLASDTATMRLLKGKVAAGLLRCTGLYLDRVVDPRPDAR